MPQVMDTTFLHEDNAALIFSPIRFRHLTVKNRLFRSNMSGMFDDYNGHGSHTRINWEEKFAKGGIGCIISSLSGLRARPHPGPLRDDRRRRQDPVLARGRRARARYDCRFILQLSHSGRQQDIGGVENLYRNGLSSTEPEGLFPRHTRPGHDRRRTSGRSSSSSPKAPGGRRRPGWTASSCTARTVT